MKRLTSLCVLMFASAVAFGQSTIVGVLPQYAAGTITTTLGNIVNRYSIDQQGNFSFGVPSNSTPTLKFAPPSGSQYGVFSFSVYAGPGITNVSAQAQGMVTVVGVKIGIPNLSVVGTDSNGNAIQGTSSGGGTTLQTNGVNNTSQTNINFKTSQANATGLVITPSNPDTDSELMEITGNINAGNVPTLNQNTTGTAGNVSGTPALPNGTSGTTQAPGDNTTKLATDAYVLANSVTATVTITTGASAGLTTTYTVNEEGTAATGVAYTLPAATLSDQHCVSNGFNGSAANTGVLTVNTSATGQFIVFTDGTLSATGGNVTSGGAARDSACFVAIDSTHWLMYTQSGTWTKH